VLRSSKYVGGQCGSPNDTTQQQIKDTGEGRGGVFLIIRSPHPSYTTKYQHSCWHLVHGRYAVKTRFCLCEPSQFALKLICRVVTWSWSGALLLIPEAEYSHFKNKQKQCTLQRPDVPLLETTCLQLSVPTAFRMTFSQTVLSWYVRKLSRTRYDTTLVTWRNPQSTCLSF
jgi:hypothetical protein